MKFTKYLILALIGAQAIKVDRRRKEEVDHSDEYFMPGDTGMIGEFPYERVLPAVFDDDNGDIFMRSMYENYALEQKTKDGSPSGKFWMDKDACWAAASEVLDTHKGLKGAQLSEYLSLYFEKTWNHFDVNQDGHIEVIKMPQFMRFLASDQTMPLQP